MALYSAATTVTASVASGTEETVDQISTAATAMFRLVRLIVGQDATTTSGQFRSRFHRASAVGGTPTAITARPMQVRDAAASTTHGVSATEPTYSNAEPLWQKAGNVLAGFEQTWQRGQSEIWLPPSAFAGFAVTPVGAAMTPRIAEESEEVG